MWTTGEGLIETAEKLALRQPNSFGKISDVDFFAKGGADDLDGLVDEQIRRDDFLGSGVALGGAHEADGLPIDVEDGELIGDIPIRNAVSIEKQLDDLDLGAFAEHDFFVIGAKMLGHVNGEKIEVRFAEHLLLFGVAKSLVEGSTSCEQYGIEAFDEKSDSGKIVEKHCQHAVLCQRAQHLLL